MIPVTAVIAAKNEEDNLRHCLPPLAKHCDEVIVLDSHSSDKTQDIVQKLGATLVPFQWNGQYPKKRQWCLDHVPMKHDWVFFIDADEIADDKLFNELRALQWDKDGYFVSSRMVWNGRLLKHGMRNNKLCLIRRDKFCFPVIDDLDIAGMGEMEGHYQPVAIEGTVTIGQVNTPITHYDMKDEWKVRHQRYAEWEACMNIRQTWPVDPVPVRQFLKSILRRSAFRPLIVFTHGYVLKGGFLDGREGFDYALARAAYARDIRLSMKRKVNNQINAKQSACSHQE